MYIDNNFKQKYGLKNKQDQEACLNVCQIYFQTHPHTKCNFFPSKMKTGIDDNTMSNLRNPPEQFL